MAYHFFVSHASIDCNMTDCLSGNANKRHQKAYGDLMYLLTERKSLVEQYFCTPVSSKVFRQLCNELYLENATSVCTVASAPSAGNNVNNDDIHLPYTLGCCFSDEAVGILYRCFVAHEVFKDITEENLKAFFDGTLSTNIKCFKSSRFGYIMHRLSVEDLITSQYQKAIGRCGYIIASGSDTPMTAECMKEAVRRAKVYSEDSKETWKRTIERDLKQLFEVMGVKEAHCRNMKA